MSRNDFGWTKQDLTIRDNVVSKICLRNKSIFNLHAPLVSESQYLRKNEELLLDRCLRGKLYRSLMDDNDNDNEL